MTLHQVISDDALTVFCNVNDFAEPVAYYPRTGPSRPISAVVFREQIAFVTEDGGETLLPIWQVHVTNDKTTGVSSLELNLGGDQVAFPPRDGKPALRKTITQLVTQDHGMLVFECR